MVVLTAGAYLPSPLYPDYQRLFGYDDLVMTLLFATFALVSGPALLLCGPAADVVGHRPVLRLSVLLAAVGSCCFALATSPAWLFAGRVGQALALGAATGAAQALITRHRGASARVGGPLLASLAFAAGTAAGPAVSGLLARYAPGPLVTPYLLHLVLLAWVWIRLHRTVPAPAPTATGTGSATGSPTRTGSASRTGAGTGAEAARQRWRPARPHIPSAVRTLFLVAGLNGFLAWAVVGIYLALVPALLGRAPHGDNPAVSGGVLGAVLVWSMLAQLVSARRTARTAQCLGVAALIASLLLLAATGATSLPATLGSALLAGTGHGLAFSGAARAVDARTPPGQRAGIGSALYLLFYLGSGVPAVAVGLMTTWMPLTSAVTRLSWAGAALGAVALLATLRLTAAARGGGGQRPPSATRVQSWMLQGHRATRTAGPFPAVRPRARARTATPVAPAPAPARPTARSTTPALGPSGPPDPAGLSAPFHTHRLPPPELRDPAEPVHRTAVRDTGSPHAERAQQTEADALGRFRSLS
ncbi:MFS transporter [Streptomyces iconiensis]|uniref:MFS transporter n=1 Tax=Streptomyces iconiensis TaxID=1384038 RepID=A0ABT6ZR73_9ACTN|nr:MFS transporter [Streptomyces iconiensis]MDJ1131274.1 MFS transporter [Streptomyces iconiensis]